MPKTEGFADKSIEKGIFQGDISVPPKPDSRDKELALKIQGMTEERVRTLFPGIDDNTIGKRIEEGRKWAKKVLEKDQ